MPRTKLRPDNKPRVFAYDIKITGDVPQVVFDTARQQQALWNEMAVRHETMLGTLKDADKETKKAAYEAFWKDAYNLTAASSLPCWAKWQIYDAFKVSQAAWAKAMARGYKQGHPLYRGMPQVRQGLRRIKIEHRTDSGGVSMDWLYADSDRKHTNIRRPEGLTRGYFSVAGERVPFEVVMHRAIPDDCILKRIALTGQYEAAFRSWTWKIIFLVEDPPRQKDHGDAVVALDLGWRRREDGIRLGVLWDGAQAHELYLPFNLANRSERKQIERYQDTEVTRDIRQIWEMQSIQDADIEAIKGQLRAADRSDWPQEARDMMSGIVKMRSGGLRRLRRTLYNAEIVLDFFEAWHDRHSELAKRIRQGQIRINATKLALYRNIAAWLSRHCKTVVWEGDLGLKEMAEAEFTEEERALKAAQKHRQFVGLYNLRQAIKHAVGSRLVDETAAYTTQTCDICGGQVATGPSVILECENGHRQDQDVNAAKVLYNRLPADLRAVTVSALQVDRSQIQRAVRPISL